MNFLRDITERFTGSITESTLSKLKMRFYEY